MLIDTLSCLRRPLLFACPKRRGRKTTHRGKPLTAICARDCRDSRSVLPPKSSHSPPMYPLPALVVPALLFGLFMIVRTHPLSHGFAVPAEGELVRSTKRSHPGVPPKGEPRFNRGEATPQLSTFNCQLSTKKGACTRCVEDAAPYEFQSWRSHTTIVHSALSILHSIAAASRLSGAMDIIDGWSCLRRPILLFAQKYWMKRPIGGRR